MPQIDIITFYNQIIIIFLIFFFFLNFTYSKILFSLSTVFFFRYKNPIKILNWRYIILKNTLLFFFLNKMRFFEYFFFLQKLFTRNICWTSFFYNKIIESSVFAKFLMHFFVLKSSFFFQNYCFDLIFLNYIYYETYKN